MLLIIEVSERTQACNLDDTQVDGWTQHLASAEFESASDSGETLLVARML